MEQEVKTEIIEDIISGVECPKCFECYRSGFVNLGKVRDIGREAFLECLEENPQCCEFSLSFGESSSYCLCPVRIYIADKLKK